jgi:hypothetical protein
LKDHKKPEDWLKLTKEDFDVNGGSELISNYYDNNAMRALQEIMPEIIFQIPNNTK